MSISKKRFQISKEKYGFRAVDKGSLLAYFNVIDTEIGVEFRDMRLMTGKNGPWVAGPFREYESKGEKKYSDYIRAAYADGGRDEMGVAYFEAMTEAAMARYEAGSGRRSSEDDEDEEEERPAKRSARGPMGRPRADASLDEEPRKKTKADLPF